MRKCYVAAIQPTCTLLCRTLTLARHSREYFMVVCHGFLQQAKDPEAVPDTHGHGRSPLTLNHWIFPENKAER
ncbi:hypothetical protein Y032_0114g417 [Ancylostoma ceylanicum]|uniref:Uncharacterized protein n=1 Tax=Ancylostoma ceylanicum TaxID=53326 RepID=A0A016TD04_9BILA|nr:hypothetical protein Y032_0114g417 [Ancylostoma ceylanicum]